MGCWSRLLGVMVLLAPVAARAEPAQEAGGTERPHDPQAEEPPVPRARRTHETRRAREADDCPCAKQEVRKQGGKGGRHGKKKLPKKTKRKRPPRPRAKLPLEAYVAAGVLDGMGTRREHALAEVIGVREVPELSYRRWRLRTPLGLEHRATQFAALEETRGSAAAELRYRRRGVTAMAELGVLGVLRPDWPDEYQPRPDGTLAPTDRYSHWDRTGAARLTVSPARRQFARLGYEYRLREYIKDPSFDPIYAPTHLVPGDSDQHSGKAGYAWRDRHAGRTELELEGGRRHYFYAFARDAGTGRTHAGPGGPPPNPLETFWLLQAGLGHAFRLTSRWRAEVGYAHKARLDPYDGYYSYQGPSPWLALEWSPSPGVQLSIEERFTMRRYGSGSYRESSSHPELEWGRRLVDTRNSARLSAEYGLARGLDLTASVALLSRWTNYPDYRPGVFPAGRRYDIDWDYDNGRVFVGLRWRGGTPRARR